MHVLCEWRGGVYLTAAMVGSCPTGWVTTAHGRYCILGTEEDFETAFTECEVLYGGAPPVFDSEAEQTALVNVLTWVSILFF